MMTSNIVLRGASFHHIALKSSDFDRSLSFYKALGCKIDFEWGSGKEHIAMIEIGGGARLELFADGADQYVPNGRWVHFALGVENVQAAYEAALALLKEANRACVIHPQHRQVLYCVQMD